MTQAPPSSPGRPTHGTTAVLRRTTRAEHQAAERAVDLAAAASSAHHYVLLLTAFATSLGPLETAVAPHLAGAGAPEEVLAGWERLPALHGDLRALDADVPPPAGRPFLPDLGTALGIAYVLEGSRLGGRVIARVVRAGLPTAAGALAFLEGPADALAPAARWAAVTRWLDARPAGERRAMVAGARLAFAAVRAPLAATAPATQAAA